MKSSAVVVIILTTIVTITAALPAGGYHDSSVADIVNYENYNSGKDGFRFQ